MRLPLALLIGLSTSASAQNSASAQMCLEYGPTVTLTGKVYSKVFPGLPNYESIKRGDRRETAVILSLAAPTCTTGKSADNTDIPETDIREVQLVMTNLGTGNSSNASVGKPVVVTGTLFHAHTAHHRTKVLLDVAELKLKQ